MEAKELRELYEARRYRDLTDALGVPAGAEDLEVARLRARLADVRWAPALDAIEAARQLSDAGADDAAEHTAHAIRLLARTGAKQSATQQLTAARERFGADDPWVQLADAQLTTGEHTASTMPEHQARLQLREGELARALALAEDRAAKTDADREWALRMIVDLARGKRDYVRAAEAFEALGADAPEAHDAPLLTACGAIARWAAGQTEAAMETLRATLERTRGRRGEYGTAFEWCADVLDRLDKEPARLEAGPAWVYDDKLGPLSPIAGDHGAAAAQVIAQRFGADDDQLPPSDTMAALRHDLRDRGLASLRAVATPARVEAALAEGAAVVLEEERSTRTAFLVVVGIEPNAGLLLMHEPERGGAFLTTFAEQRARANLFGGSMLVVLGGEEEAEARRARLAERELKHDLRFDAIDACDLDENGRVPPRARVDVLSQKAIEAAPDLPTPHRRLGEAMLDQLRAGRLGRGRLERWVAVTREKFPRAEWALQTYAQALEIWGRPHEAGIAWADAQRLDDWDHRNLYGRARAHLRIGEPAAAEGLLRRTLALAPENAGAMARWAQLRLDQGDLERAVALSELAEEIAPEHADVLNTRATVLERQDRFDEALARLERVSEARPNDTTTRARCLKRMFHAGRWDDAAVLADRNVAADPGDPFNWADLAFVQVARGDVSRAPRVVLDGLARCGNDRALVDEAARVLGTLLDVDARADYAAQLTRTLASTPLSLMDIAVELTRRRLDDEGIALALQAKALLRDDPNGPWRAAQTLAALPEVRAADLASIEGLLEETLAVAGNYPHPRVLYGLLLLSRDPERARALLEEADVRSGPVLVWKARALVHTALGDAAASQQNAARLDEVGPQDLVDAGMFLRNVGEAAAAMELFELAQSRQPGNPRVVTEAMRTRLRVGDVEGAAAWLGKTEAPDVFVGTLVALANRDWGRALELAEPEVARVTRKSASGAYDGWVMRGRVAGAKLALGDPEPAGALRERAGAHADAMLAFLEVARVAGLDLSDDAHRLAELAPGAALTLDRGGLRW